MKKSLLFGMMLLASAATVNAQEVVQVGSLEDASSTTKFPWYSSYECSSSEIVYTADDLKDLPAGDLSKLEFAVTGGQMTYIHLRVWLENTDDTQVVGATSGAIRNTDEMTKVYDTAGKGYSMDERTLQAYSGTGYLDCPFDTNFKYTGGGLRIRFEATGENWCLSEFAFFVDQSKVNASSDKNCSTIYDFTESGMKTRSAEAERSFPVVQFTVEEKTTAINDVDVEEVKNVTYYNIYGQKVDADAKGLVISSEGKKFFRN
ncbi:MAG: hypothetical protein KBT09_10000 [Bacteroidales bacterium]|nr:hypothetical protein [Candidatus Sodaliphilus fimicaballi]